MGYKARRGGEGWGTKRNKPVEKPYTQAVLQKVPSSSISTNVAGYMEGPLPPVGMPGGRNGARKYEIGQSVEWTLKAKISTFSAYT